MRRRRALLPAPYKLGAPRKFTEYRESQDEVIMRVVACKARFVAVVAPTGFGKTLMSFLLAKLEAQRAVLLTATRGLQDQVHGDFASAGLVDIRGAGNYACEFERFEPDAARRSGLLRDVGPAENAFFKSMGWKERKTKTVGVVRTCDDAPCHSGSTCRGKLGGCTYFDAVRAAHKAELFDTNYSYWMASHAYSGGLGKVGIMLADEAHEIPEELSRHLRVSLSSRQLARCRTAVSSHPPVHGGARALGEWAAWSFEVLKRLAIPAALACQDDAARMARLPSDIRDLGRVLHRLREVGKESDWAIERDDRGALVFEPVDPAPYAEESLWLRTPKIVLTSATVRGKTLDLIGVPEKEREIIELPSVFDPERRPIYIVPGPRLSAKAPASAFRDAVRIVDAIIGARLDRKTIVHTVSYERARELQALSKYEHRMLLFTAKSKAQAVDLFKQAGIGPYVGPVVLVGPALETGYDFPDAECRCQIILKIGFPDSRGAVMAARQKRWRWYGLLLAMLALVQAVGRACRSKADWCENFVIDGNAGWFIAGNKAFAPRAFLEALRWRKKRATIEEVIVDLPKPPNVKTGPVAA